MNKMELTELLMTAGTELFKEFEQARNQSKERNISVDTYNSTGDKLTVEEFISDKFAKRIGDTKKAKKTAENIKYTILNYYELSDRIHGCPSVDDFVENELIKIMDERNLTNTEKAEFLSSVETMCRASTKEYFKDKLKSPMYDENAIKESINSWYYCKHVETGEVPTDKDIRRILNRVGESANLSVLFVKPELLSDAIKDFAEGKNYISHSEISTFAEEANKIVMTEYEQQVIYSYALYILALDNKIDDTTEGFDEKLAACYVMAGYEQAKVFYALSNRQITAEKAAYAITMIGHLTLLLIIKLLPVALLTILFAALEIGIIPAIVMSVLFCAMAETAEENDYYDNSGTSIADDLEDLSQIIYKKLVIGISKALEFVDSMNTTEENLETEYDTNPS